MTIAQVGHRRQTHGGQLGAGDANGRPVSVEDLRSAVEKSKSHVALLVQRGETRLFVPVRVG